MENPPEKFDENQDDFEEEWAGFCSSCKSVFESICNVGQPSDLYKFLEDSNSEESRSARGFEGHAIATEMTNMSTINRSGNKVKDESHESTPLKSNHEKCGHLTEVADDDILPTAKRNSKRLKSYNQNLNAEKTLQEIVKKHASTEVESFIDNAMFLTSAEPSIRSQREFSGEDTSNILKFRNSILQTTNRLMDLSNSLDNMREVILKQVKKQTTRNNRGSIEKTLPDCETSARTTNRDKRCFNEISDKENLMYTYNPFSSTNKKKEKASCANSEILSRFVGFE